MTSRQRYAQPSAFAETNGFDEQLYHALRQSPWWMISLAVHVLLFVISGLMPTSEPVVTAPPIAHIETHEAVDAPDTPDTEDPPDLVETQPTKSSDLVSREPAFDAPVLDDKVEDDNDLPNEDTYGNTTGDMAGDFDGISTNTLIGPGGGWSKGARPRRHAQVGGRACIPPAAGRRRARPAWPTRSDGAGRPRASAGGATGSRAPTPPSTAPAGHRTTSA
jgi:hypothetical protein